MCRNGAEALITLMKVNLATKIQRKRIYILCFEVVRIFGEVQIAGAVREMFLAFLFEKDILAFDWCCLTNFNVRFEAQYFFRQLALPSRTSLLF